MANLIGILVSAAIDRQNGDSGIKGAVIGKVTESILRVLVPIVATYAIGWAILYEIRRIAHAASDGPAGFLDHNDQRLA